MGDNALWPFALRLYGSDGVAEAFLDLQDRDGANVTLLLYAAWAGEVRGWRMDAAAVAEAAGAVGPWHREIVEALRAVRRRMKAGPAPAPSPATEALRDKLKAVEIGSEKLELEVLEGLAPDGTGGGHGAANMEAMMAAFGAAPVSEAARAALARVARAAAAAVT